VTALRNSVGVWAFGPAVTRFVPPGYHPEAANEPMVDKTRRTAWRISPPAPRSPVNGLTCSASRSDPAAPPSP
jgi:hypothetical protein